MVWIVIILFFLIPAILLLITDPTGKKHTDKDGRDNFGMNELLDECRIYINDSVCRDYSELYLNREETLKREKQQARLKQPYGRHASEMQVTGNILRNI